ncbi:MAG TPA: SDR family NAD(P)-dependent oxidoreductase [Edaphobacter sp.]|jgi:short-subunit dehydrogenase|nr:SDR family NAD(P)-dependent oxidoreductase [Edaphobacter sp.]
MESRANGSFAVITGASSGIGLELAKQFAQHGFDLLVVADSPKIAGAAHVLKSYNVSVTDAQIDLAKTAGVDEFYRLIRQTGRPVDALALNAGVGAGGDFVRETALEADFNVIDLNVRSTVHLAKLVLKDMVQRGQGRVLFTSSIAATMPGTFNAVYNASKAFIQSFAQAVRNELKDTGVTITALMPGATETNFFHRAGMDDTKIAKSEKDDPADVAKTGFEALMAGEDHVVAGSFKNKVQATMAHVLPDALTADMHRKQAGHAGANRPAK